MADAARRGCYASSDTARAQACRCLGQPAPVSRPQREAKGTEKCQGRAHPRILPRNILHVAATAAIRFNPGKRNFHDRLTGEGTAHKIALTAGMRKLVMLANVLVRDDRAWSPAAPEPNAGKASACKQPCGQVRDNLPVTGQDPRNRPWVGLNPGRDATGIDPSPGADTGFLKVPFLAIRLLPVSQSLHVPWRVASRICLAPQSRERSTLGPDRSGRPEPVILLTTFSRSVETLLLKLFHGRLPQKVIEPAANTHPPAG